jgi:hypothetical protein
MKLIADVAYHSYCSKEETADTEELLAKVMKKLEFALRKTLRLKKKLGNLNVTVEKHQNQIPDSRSCGKYPKVVQTRDT